MLELAGVSAGYGTHTVLRGIDLAVPDGTVVALVGANGAGKTTLLRVASGVLRPSRGHVALDGADATAWSARGRSTAGIGYVPQGRGVFGALSVADNLTMQRAELPTALGGRLRQRASTLSGGEQQLLALARLDRGGTTVGLVDEVSAGLAPRAVDEIYAHLRALADSGMALLVVEQHVRRALDFADHVYVLRRGRIAFAGEPAELDDQRLVAAYLGASR